MKKRIISVAIVVLIIIVSIVIIKSTSNGMKYKIGIAQFAAHASLDTCRKGFIEGLKQDGIIEGKNLKIEYQNANSDGGTANLISNTFISHNNDLLLGIATPMAQSLYNVAQNTDVPVLFLAVTFPESAGLIDGNVTGTSDRFSPDKRLQLIKSIIPNVKKIGVIHSTSEINADYSLKELQDVADKYDVQIIDKGISSSGELQLAAESIAKEVDCFCLVIDNTITASVSVLIDVANRNNIPVFCNEENEVKLGGLACDGIDYYNLGIETGKMASKILKGERKASEMKYECIEDTKIYINTNTFKMLNINIPNDLLDKSVDVINND